MKILLLTTHLNIGGIAVYTVNLAKGIKKNGHDVVVASSGGDMTRELELVGIKHINIDIRTKSEFGLKMWKSVPKLVNIIKQEGVELVHAQTRVAQVLAALSSRVTDVSFISTGHGFYKYQKLFRKVFPCWGDKVIAISKSVRQHLIKDFHVRSERVSLVYNGIYLSPYIDSIPEKDQDLMGLIGVPSGTNIIGSVGRLSSVKGYQYLIKAFKNIIDKRQDCRLVLVGSGPEKGALVRLVEKLKIQDKVIFVPEVKTISSVLSIIDIFCLPSINEGLGLSLMEAMASGRACIASNAGGLKELIENGETGILIPSRDDAALEKGILKILNNEQFRVSIASKARKKALKCFSLEESIEKTIKIYEEVLKDF